MGEDPGAYPPQSLMLQLPHLLSLNAPPIIGQHSPMDSLSTDPGVANASSYAYPELTPSEIGQFGHSHGWFYCLPRFRQAGLSNSAPREKLLPFPATIAVNPSSGDAQRKFLVVDQSGGQTTLMVSSGIGTPFRCLTSWSSRNPNIPDCMKDGVKDDPHTQCGARWRNDAGENYGCDSPSEMHEDSDELNALLYSSDEDDGFGSEDDEVASTGHSPSTMTTHERRCSGESMDEVASCGWPVRKRKLLGEEPLDDTASSGKSMNCQTDYIHDENNYAESSCGNGNMCSNNKRIRRDKIRETVSVLQDMIPGGGMGKDAVVVLDEAIHYLKSLKANARA